MNLDKGNPKIYEEVACNICGSRRYKIKYRPARGVKDYRKIISASGGIRGTQQIVQCENCGLIYVNPRIRPGLVVSAYANADDSLYATQAEARIDTFKAALRLIEKYTGFKTGRILDVGAAAGFFLKAAKDGGWETYGVEPSRWSVDFGNENYDVNIKKGTLDNIKFKEEFFDVVTMWDVLEHVPNPKATLKEVYRILKPGGCLIVNYPDIGTPLAQIMGSRWWFLLSVHLFYFDKSSITNLLKRSGFVNPIFRPHWQSLSLGHLAKMASLYSKFASSFLQKIFSLTHLNNFGVKYYASQTNVIAKKPKK